MHGAARPMKGGPNDEYRPPSTHEADHLDGHAHKGATSCQAGDPSEAVFISERPLSCGQSHVNLSSPDVQDPDRLREQGGPEPYDPE
jgi:hypothetical protein